MVVELECDADHVVAIGLEQRRGYRRIDATGHRNDDARVLRTPFDLQAVAHSRLRIGLSPADRWIRLWAITTSTACPRAMRWSEPRKRHRNDPTCRIFRALACTARCHAGKIRGEVI